MWNLRRLPSRTGCIVTCAFLWVSSLEAQTPQPTRRPPDRLRQDDLDVQTQSNIVRGAGARAFGMGGAFVARADDATAASWNPAGLSYLRRPELSLVWSAFSAADGRAFDLESGTLLTRDRRRSRPPEFAAVTYPFTLRSITGAAQISYQRVISFDGHRTLEFPDGRNTVDSEGGFDVVALGSGWSFPRKLRIGITVNRWVNGYSQRRFRELPNGGTSDQHLILGFSGWNVNIGAMFTPWESLNLGAVAKTAFRADVHLRRWRADVPPPASLGGRTLNSFARGASLDFPAAFGVGASWRPRTEITISTDYTRTYWSKAEINNFFTLQRAGGGVTPVPQAPNDLFDRLPYPLLFDFSGLGQTDTQQVRAGVEYVATLNGMKLPLRAGYFSDTLYFRGVDGRAPRLDAWTAGAGLVMGPVLIDVAYVNESGDYIGYSSEGDPVRTSVSVRTVLLSTIYRFRR